MFYVLLISLILFFYQLLSQNYYFLTKKKLSLKWRAFFCGCNEWVNTHWWFDKQINSILFKCAIRKWLCGWKNAWNFKLHKIDGSRLRGLDEKLIRWLNLHPLLNPIQCNNESRFSCYAHRRNLHTVMEWNILCYGIMDIIAVQWIFNSDETKKGEFLSSENAVFPIFIAVFDDEM